MKNEKMKTSVIKTNSKYKSIAVNFLILLTIATPFLLGKFCELNSPGPFDSGSYVCSAKHVLSGAKIGVDEHPSAQLGTLLANILGVWIFGFNDFGPKIIQAILQAAALGLMFYTLKEIFNKTAAFLSTFLACFLLSAPLLAKFGNVKEQYMIAFMILGISSYALRVSKGGLVWGLLAGFFVALGPLFKQTGLSAIGAIAVFMIVCVVLRWRSIKSTAFDIALLLTGAAISLGPIFLWINIAGVKIELPYKFLWDITSNAIHAIGPSDASEISQDAKIIKSEYVERGRKAFGLSKQAPIVFRYYWTLRLPIILAAVSIITAKIRLWLHWFARRSKIVIDEKEKFVFLFGTWWFFDMLFVWISPRPYEQYYLPLCASAAMTGGYLFWLLREKQRSALPANKPLWVGLNMLGLFVMTALSWHIFFGLTTSPYSNKEYKGSKGETTKKRGYTQGLHDSWQHYKKEQIGPWENVGEYIKKTSTEHDRIYVWGWYPGIYVKAQRFSSFPKASESDMHVMSPEQLSRLAKRLVKHFESQPPSYIVDSRKIHFPNDRPALEFWPSSPKGFLPANEQIVKSYESAYGKAIAEKIEIDEAKRFEAMKPIRDFIRENYIIIDAQNYRFSKSGIYHPVFGQHVIFKYTQKSK